MQKGSAQLLLILGAVIVIFSGIYFYRGNNNISNNNTVLQSPNIAKQSKNYDYSNKDLGFEFKYSKDFTVRQDSEEEFNKRGNGDFRKNFKGYVQYEPGKFIGAEVVLDKSGSFDVNPFTAWVFDNPNDSSIDKWYKNYWYYPFVWGDFTQKGKVDLAPKEEATISGTIGKSGIIDYQLGKPKFIYVAKEGKMYLLRIIGESGNKILDTFTFLK